MSPGPAFLDSLAHLAGYISAVTRTTFIAPSGPYAVLSVLSALVLATAVLGHRRLRSRPRGRRRLRLGVLARAYFPRRFFRSASSQADMGLALFNVFLFGLLFGWALLSSQVISNHTGAGLAAILGAPAPTALPGYAAVTIMTLTMFMAHELAYWIVHYLSHRVPLLWEFHKVHHSAETLSPLTNARVHPVDTLFYYNVTALVMGLAGGIAQFALGHPVQPYSIWSTNLLALVFAYSVQHLQHSHVWIAFTGVWGRLLLSPAHHQIHHSTNPAHFNRNLGSAVAVFDWAFGTLHVPAAKREKLSFGVEPKSEAQHTVTGMLVTPILDAASHLKPAAAKPALQPGDGAKPQNA